MLPSVWGSYCSPSFQQYYLSGGVSLCWGSLCRSASWSCSFCSRMSAHHSNLEGHVGPVQMVTEQRSVAGLRYTLSIPLIKGNGPPSKGYPSTQTAIPCPVCPSWFLVLPRGCFLGQLEEATISPGPASHFINDFCESCPALGCLCAPMRLSQLRKTPVHCHSLWNILTMELMALVSEVVFTFLLKNNGRYYMHSIFFPLSNLN